MIIQSLTKTVLSESGKILPWEEVSKKEIKIKRELSILNQILETCSEDKLLVREYGLSIAGKDYDLALQKVAQPPTHPSFYTIPLFDLRNEEEIYTPSNLAQNQERFLLKAGENIFIRDKYDFEGGYLYIISKPYLINLKKFENTPAAQHFKKDIERYLKELSSE